MGMFGNAFKSGGAGRDIAGYVGDALLTLGGGRPMYAPAKAELRQQSYLLDRQGQQQANMLQRQMQLAAFKAQNPDPTAMQRNYEYLKSLRPDLAETYLRASANPMIFGVDPATGAPRAMPKAGPDPQAPVSKILPDGTTAYWVNGDWYDNPEGK